MKLAELIKRMLGISEQKKEKRQLVPEHLFGSLAERTFGWTSGLTGPRAVWGCTCLSQGAVGFPSDEVCTDDLSLEHIAEVMSANAGIDEKDTLDVLRSPLPDVTEGSLSVNEWLEAVKREFAERFSGETDQQILNSIADTLDELASYLKAAYGREVSELRIASIEGVRSYAVLILC